MDYGFFYNVAKYGNEAWRGGFNEREIAEHAYEYKREWDYSLQTHIVSGVITGLLRNLKEDIGEILVNPKADANIGVMLCNWVTEIESEIKYYKLKKEA